MKEKLELIINKIKEETKKECYSFEIVEGKADITDTKLGGYPYLPKGGEYPSDENGNPYALLFHQVLLQLLPESAALRYR